MHYELTDRGFKHYDPIPTSYGHVVKVYESSNGAEPYIWMTVDPAASVLRGEADAPELAVHLTLEQAAAVRDALDEAITQHYQLKI